MLLILTIAPAKAYPHSLWLRMPSANWSDGTALSLPLAYTIGIVLAACVCLPSFYFYSLLAVVRMAWLQNVSLGGKGTAPHPTMALALLPCSCALLAGLVSFHTPPPPLPWPL